MDTNFLTNEYQLITDLWFIIIVVLVVSNTIAIVFLIRKLAGLLEQSRKNTDFRRKSESSNLYHQDNGSIDLMRRMKKIEDILENKTNALLKPNDEKPSLPIIDSEKSVEINLSVPKKTQQVEFYMSTPNADGSFDVVHKTDAFKPTISLYKFTAQSDQATRASFEFFSDDFGIKDALNNPKRFIEPVCYEINDPFPGSKKIAMQKTGFAIKVDDQWRVEKDSKAQIKYE